MTREAIIETLTPFIDQFISTSSISPDQDLFSSGLVNSLFAMQMVLFIEKEYGFKVENEDLDFENFKSLNRLADFIEVKTAVPS